MKTVWSLKSIVTKMLRVISFILSLYEFEYLRFHLSFIFSSIMNEAWEKFDEGRRKTCSPAEPNNVAYQELIKCYLLPFYQNNSNFRSFKY